MSKPVESVVTQPVYIHDVRKEQQDWLREARRFCRCVGIGVSGWGADTLIVEAKSPDHTKQISSQLRRFGWSPIENEDDAGAGLLLLSRNSAATRPNKSSAGISRRSWDAQIVPLLWGAGSIVSFRTGINSPTPSSWHPGTPASILNAEEPSTYEKDVLRDNARWGQRSVLYTLSG